LFSQKLDANPALRNPQTRDRVALGKVRVLSILDRETVAHQKTLEQKIADQGPKPQRVDPHLVGLAISDLLELNRIRKLEHAPTQTTSWFTTIATPETTAQTRLSTLAPIYAATKAGHFGNLVGDALEIITHKALEKLESSDPKYTVLGAFDLSQPKDNNGRYKKIPPPKYIGKRTSPGEPDYFLLGHETGPVLIECKNYREWIYPNNSVIAELIKKSLDFNATPILVARRIHYSTIRNFLQPAGIIAHETYFQYYPLSHVDLAAQAADKKLLGFTDVRATETPDTRTEKFFVKLLPSILPDMSAKWAANRVALRRYATDEINLAQLYTEIGSPAGGKWIEYDAESHDF
jgi:hypothetical protein